MSIKAAGGIFGRNPTFRNVEVEGNLTVDGTLTIGGSVITGLNYQGGWDASTNTPDLTVLSPPSGQFWIVSADGNTNLGGITNWTSGDWALYDGSAWQRVEGGNTDLDTGVSGTLKILNGGTGANDAATARTNLGLGSAATTDSTDYATAAQGSLASSSLQPGDIGSTVQGYDADTAKYDDTTANFTGTLQNGGSNVVVDTDIGSTVQAYDADTAKLDAAQTWTGQQDFATASATSFGVGTTSPSADLEIAKATGSATLNPVVLRLRSTTDGGSWDQTNPWAKLSFYSDDTSSGGIYERASIDAIAVGAGGGGTSLSFKVLETEQMLLTLDGNLNLKQGNLVIGTSGKGIDFSATSGTGTSELLDDYEEGTWTPVLTTNGTDFSSITYDGLRAGKYTKTGNTVYVSLTMRTDAVTVGSASGSVAIGGLPFTVNGNSSLAVSQCEQWAGEEPIAAYAQTSTTYIRLMYRSSVTGNTASTQVADVATGANGNEIQVSGFYFV